VLARKRVPIHAPAAPSAIAAARPRGWTAEFGITYAVNTRWSLGLEYLYVDLGKSTLNAPAYAPPGIPGFVPSSTTFSHVDQMVRLNLDFRLGSVPR
jgi:opacity protein-like surface antigen